MKNNGYFISTGDKSGFYTLRRMDIEPTYEMNDNGDYACTGSTHKETFLQNLSTNRNEAIAKAKALTGHDLEVGFELTDIERLKAEEYALLREQKKASILAFIAANTQFSEMYNFASQNVGNTFASVRGEYEISTIRDIIQKLEQYGSISEGQTGFAITLYARLVETIEQTKVIEAAKAALLASGAKAPEGKQSVSGTILGFKEVDSYINGRIRYTTKAIIQLDNGTKCYGTLASCSQAMKGAKVTFTADFQISNTDPLFSFYKRPTKWVETMAEEAIAA